MAYNFKSIADVDIVEEPSEEAHVLIEEGGVIKKAPKTAVGGGEYVLDIDIICSYDPDEDDIVCDYTVHQIDTFANIKNRLFNGESLQCKSKLSYQPFGNPDSPYVTEVLNGIIIHYPRDNNTGTPEYLQFMFDDGWYIGCRVILTLDNIIQFVDLL